MTSQSLCTLNCRCGSISACSMCYRGLTSVLVSGLRLMEAGVRPSFPNGLPLGLPIVIGRLRVEYEDAVYRVTNQGIPGTRNELQHCTEAFGGIRPRVGVACGLRPRPQSPKAVLRSPRSIG